MVAQQSLGLFGEVILSNPEHEHNWDLLWRGIREIHEWFPDSMVMIGGIAVWLHAKTVMDCAYIDLSYDADFYLSMADYADLREIEVVTQNRRLGKCQIIKNGIDFDIYVENQSSLSVPYVDIVAHSVVIDGIRCACLGHLLSLKYKAWQDRKASSKGGKDLRDLARILVVQGHLEGIDAQTLDYLPVGAIHEIRDAVLVPAIFKEIARGNAFVGKQMQRKAINGIDQIEKAAALGENPGESDPQGADSPQ